MDRINMSIDNHSDAQHQPRLGKNVYNWLAALGSLIIIIIRYDSLHTKQDG